jgi:precorrin-6B methylase 1
VLFGSLLLAFAIFCIIDHIIFVVRHRKWKITQTLNKKQRKAARAEILETLEYEHERKLIMSLLTV